MFSISCLPLAWTRVMNSSDRSLHGAVIAASVFVVGALFWKNVMKQRNQIPSPLVRVVKPLGRVVGNSFTVFTAGSIEMGKAEDWQTVFTKGVEKRQIERLDNGRSVRQIVVCNPRRDDWNADWNNTKYHPLVHEQIRWELDHLESCDLIVLHFEGNTISPITLLELGIFIQSGKLIVHCPDEYFRAENVLETCTRYKVPLAKSIQELIAMTISRANK